MISPVTREHPNRRRNRLTPAPPAPDLSLWDDPRAKGDPFYVPPEPAPPREFKLSVGIVRVRDREMQKRQQRVTADLPVLIRRYFGYDLMPFHLEMYRRLFRLSSDFTEEAWDFRWSWYYPNADESDPDLFQVMLVPTDHGKSITATEVFPILSLMEDPNAAHIICSPNLSEARQLTARIASHLDGSDPQFADLLHDYPWVGRPERERWAMSDFNVAGRSDRQNRNPSIHATGAGANDIKSRRAKFIGDDLEGEDSQLASSRDKLYRWASLAAVRCVEDPGQFPRPLHAYVGTPFDVDSFYFRLELENFQVLRLPFRYPALPGQRVGEMIWPQRKRKVEALKRRLTPRAFRLQMYLDPTGGDSTALTFDQLRELAEDNPLEPSNRPQPDPEWHLIFCDPAAGSKKRGVDYAGIGVCDIRWPVDDDLPHVTVREPRVFKEGVIEQVDLLADLCRKLGYHVIVETNGSQARTYWDLMAHHHPDVVGKMIGHHTNPLNRGDKLMGLTVVKTLLMQKRLTVIGRPSPELDDDDEDLEFSAGDTVDPDVRQFLNEVRDLQDPNAHNHISAGVWFCIWHAYAQRRTSQFQVVNRVRSRGGFGFGGRAYGGYAGTRTLSLTPQTEAPE